MDGEHLPSLYRNGALDPDEWRPSTTNLRSSIGARYDAPEEGDLLGWRYGVWEVIESKPVPAADRDDGASPQARAVRHGPWIVVVKYVSGPLILGEDEGQRLHDGSRTAHFRSSASTQWPVLTDPYQVCSCHGHVWPCQERDQAVLTAHQLKQMDRLIATVQPGVCAHCLEAISTRQKTLTFPEPSRYVPGAPGPTFHAGRGECWGGAEQYEREGRLADNPDVPRLASCPGIRFIHEQHGMPAGQRLDCTAGPECTGLHGPAGYRRETPCHIHVGLASNEGAYARPTWMWLPPR